MPGTSSIALLDEVASVLDDVATLTKVAATKTAGVLGDDIALNAQQVAGRALRYGMFFDLTSQALSMQ
jgi:predicted DNA repair protein MutK